MGIIHLLVDQENFEEWQARRRATQQSSGIEIDPAEESRAAYEAWKDAVGPNKKGRLVGAGGIGSAFQNSIIPNLSGSSDERSTGRSYVPSSEELNAVQQLTQKLSETQRELEERQTKHEQEMAQMMERQRISDERLNQFMAMYPRPPSMPSSSSPPFFSQQSMQHPNYGGGSFQQYQGGYPPSYQPNNYQPQQFSQPQHFSQPQQYQQHLFGHLLQPQQPQQVYRPQLPQSQQPTQGQLQGQGQVNSDNSPPLSETDWFGLENNEDNNNIGPLGPRQFGPS